MAIRFACLLLVASGCAKLPYQYGGNAGAAADRSVAVHYGDAHPRLDKAARIVQWPKRLFKRNKLADPGEVSTETVESLTTYLEKNDLADVKVDVSEYRPAEQWARLRDNTHFSPGMRYTFGSLGVLRYTLLPDRVFSHNAYYPYTNTLSLNSNEPGLALHEAAIAKAVYKRRFPGLYAATVALPGLSLGPRIEATSDVLSYAQTEADWKLEKETYQDVYPRIAGHGGDAASTFVPVWWAGPALSLAGSAAGTVAGKAVIKRREAELAEQQDRVDHLDASVRQAGFMTPSEEAKTVDAVRLNESPSGERAGNGDERP